MIMLAQNIEIQRLRPPVHLSHAGCGDSPMQTGHLPVIVLFLKLLDSGKFSVRWEDTEKQEKRTWAESSDPSCPKLADIEHLSQQHYGTKPTS